MKTLTFLKFKLALLPVLLLTGCQPSGMILLPSFSGSNSSVMVTGIVGVVAGLILFGWSKGFRKKITTS